MKEVKPFIQVLKKIMSNKIILTPQKFKFSDLASQFPTTGKVKKKVFFQSELRSLTDGNATFGIIAYPAWRGTGKWEIGTKVAGTDAGTPVALAFVPPVGFANNELIFEATAAKRKIKKHKQFKLLKLIKKISGDKKLFKTAFFHFETTISENPHLQYKVTLEIEGTAVSVDTKPSPPAPPEA
jgi:hypothetical protein